MTVYRLSVGGHFLSPHQNQGGHTLWQSRKLFPNWKQRKRTHHLITRGAAIESGAPLTKVLTETEFYAFEEKALAVPEVKGLLMEAVNEDNRAEQKERR